FSVWNTSRDLPPSRTTPGGKPRQVRGSKVKSSFQSALRYTSAVHSNRAARLQQSLPRCTQHAADLLGLLVSLQHHLRTLAGHHRFEFAQFEIEDNGTRR